jgi:hypothetical protein
VRQIAQGKVRRNKVRCGESALVFGRDGDGLGWWVGTKSTKALPAPVPRDLPSENSLSPIHVLAFMAFLSAVVKYVAQSGEAGALSAA